MLLISAAKLLLIGGNEILAIPDDSVNYAQQAVHSLGRIGAPSGYPIWLALSQYSGLPQRIAIEILYLAGAAAVSGTIGRSTSRLTGIVVFAALAFAPSSFFLFDHAWSDGFFGCLGLYALALSISILTRVGQARRSLAEAACAGVIFGWMLITRSESPVIAAWLLLLVGLHGAYHWPTMNRRAWLKHELALCLVLTATTLSIPLMRAQYARQHEGVFATSVASLPSHMALLQRLAAIDPGTPSPERVPVSRAQRAAAYAVSPALNELASRIEDPDNMYQQASLHAGDARGEIGAGFAWHIFNDAAIANLKERNLLSLDTYYRRVNEQLDVAFADGRLKRKWIIHPLLGGDLVALIKRLPSSFGTVYRLSFRAVSYLPDIGYEAALFDTACLRRADLTAKAFTVASVSGWAFLEGAATNIKLVELESRSPLGIAQWQRSPHIAREDVANAFGHGKDLPSVYGFTFRDAVSSKFALKLRYTLEDGTVFLIESLTEGKLTRLDIKRQGLVVTQGIDQATIHSPETTRSLLQSNLNEFFEILFPWLTPTLLVSAVGLALLVRHRLSSTQGKRRLVVLIILFAGLAVERIIFYSAIDAGAWVVEVRYMFMAALLSICVAVLSLHLILLCIAILVNPNHAKPIDINMQA